MNSKKLRLLRAIFTQPTPKNINWNDIELFLRKLECEILEGKGSRIKVLYKGKVLNIHRPHPQKEAKAYQVRLVKDFLIKIGVTP